jgi:hypothetical protein
LSNGPNAGGQPFIDSYPMTTAVPTPPRSTRAAWLGAAALTLVIAGLHGWLLFHAGAFCGDEVNVINLADTHSLSLMTRDSFPVLLPVLVGVWKALGLGGSDLALRCLGLVIGLGAAGALWLPALIARRAPPLLGLIFFGLNGLALYWTDYLRAYGLGSLFILLTLAAICWLLNQPTWKRTGILALAAVLSVQTLYQNAVFFAAIGFGGWLVCWMRKDQATALKILVAALPAVVSLLPYLRPLLRWQAGTTIRPGFSFTAALDNLHTMLAFPVPQYFWLWGLLGVMVAGLGAAALVRRETTAARADLTMTVGERQVFAGVILLAAVLGYWIFLHFAALITSPWYFVPLMAVAAACFDLSISVPAGPRWLCTAVGAVLIGTVGWSIPFAVRDLNCRYSNMDLAAAGRLAKEVSPQDYVVVTPWYLGISFNHYYHGPAAWDSLPPVADHGTYRFDLVPTTEAGLAQAGQPVLERMTATLQSGHRVWVVGWMRIPDPGRKASTPEGRLLTEHSRRFEAVDLGIKGQTSDYENVSLLEAEGWKTQY